jgi:hypothetical protein
LPRAGDDDTLGLDPLQGMVTKLSAGHRMERITAFLFGSFSSSHKFLGTAFYYEAVAEQVSRPAVVLDIGRCWV